MNKQCPTFTRVYLSYIDLSLQNFFFSAPTRKTIEEEKSVMYQDDSTKPKDKITVSAKISNTSVNVQAFSKWALLFVACIANILRDFIRFTDVYPAER